MSIVDLQGKISKAQLRRLRKAWSGMIERCTYEKHKSYDRYGGRGITVCDEWKSWPNFLKWSLKNGYAPGLELDRIDNNGGYRPDNCRYVTHEQNCNNTESNVFVDAANETKSLAQWGRDSRSKVSRKTIGRRLKKGMAGDEAISRDPYFETKRIIEAFGERKTLAEWVEDPRCQIPYSALLYRIDHSDCTPEDAISKPSGYFSNGIKGELFLAWGEMKTMPEWANDERARAGESTIRQRIVAYGWEVERAISTPSRRYRKK